MAFSKPRFSAPSQALHRTTRTKGMLIGEGSVMFVMKRLADAERDGDRIHAVLRELHPVVMANAPGYIPLR